VNRPWAVLGTVVSAIFALPSCSTSALGGAQPDAGPTEPQQCTAARDTHLVPVSSVSRATVKVISNAGGVTTIYVDASAGGANEASRNPRVYIKLTGERVDVDDRAAFSSSDWDLALKRVDIFTNGGDAGPGKGGAVRVSKAFASVTAADADAATIGAERFFDEECVGRKDEASFIITTFSGWYNYEVGAGPSVRPGISYIVLGADGKTRYKVGFASYTAQADGGTEGQATGIFLLKVAQL
jgi:hypothetical protein